MTQSKNIKISFVILHYLTLKDTVKCIESIIDKIDVEDYKIIVIDNASTNGTGNLLKESYKEYDKVEVVCLDRNLGFSGGNNIGFKIAKEKYISEYIVLLNNDTYLLEDKFYFTVNVEYAKSKFAVLGPMIFTPDNTYSNPVRKNLITLEELDRWERYLKIHLIMNSLYIESLLVKSKKVIINLIERFTKNTIKNNIESFNYNERYEYVQLHGSCLIFSKEYYSNFDGLDDRTFLYGEEDILYARLILNSLKSVYSPELKIFHVEDSATNTIFSKNSRKRRFLYKHKLNSIKIIKEYSKKVYGTVN